MGIDVIRKIITVIAVIMLVAGLGLLLFPIVSNTLGTLTANSQTEKFDHQIENLVSDKTYKEALSYGEIDKDAYPIDKEGKRTSDMPKLFKEDLERLFKDSVEYNENLRENQASLLTNDYSYTVPSLNLSNYGINDGIYGYVSAPSIDMKLPVYLGANDLTMSYGVAHLTYTSLPVGGERSNVVLAGHTGYVGRIFFDNLRNLKLGDTVKFRNYWTTIEYEVVKTEIHKPSDSQNIFINDDRDLLTMITCISNGSGDFDRYYVICESKASKK